jgi:hypothetical protein
MPDRLAFDDRLLNRFTVEDLEKSYPPLHAALQFWFKAFSAFDDTGLAKLIAARGQDEIDKWKAKGEAALATIPGLVQTLDTVIRELESALTRGSFPERRQLEGLLESARRNRTALVEEAPALVDRALGSLGGYDATKSEAAAAVGRTAKRLEEMRARSEDTARVYRELQPMVAELQETWAALDRALAPLSRQDQRAAREPQDPRMREAATALCRNLFTRKMRDRAAGEWPAPAIAAPGDSAPERLAAALARGDYAAAHATLAPWLAAEWSVERLEQEITRSASEIAAGFAIPVRPPAGGFEVGSNPLSYDEIRDDRLGESISDEVTAENFLGWFPIRIQTEEEDEYLTDLAYLVSLYAIAVSTSEGERIGFLRLEE